MARMFFISIFLLVSISAGAETSGGLPEVWVDDDFTPNTPGWQVYSFNKIQKGIQAVETKGIVHVLSGGYYENLVVDKELILFGEDWTSTVVDGGGSGHVIAVSAPRVKIQGFTIRNSGSLMYPAFDSGIYVTTSENIFSDNLIMKNTNGISCYENARNNAVFMNRFQGCAQNGIYMEAPLNNLVMWNHLEGSVRGIYLKGANVLSGTLNNVIHGNILKNNSIGIFIKETCYNLIQENLATKNISGCYIDYFSKHNTVIKNCFKNNTNYGLRSDWVSHCNTFSFNTLSGNKKAGLCLWHSSLNKIKGNNIHSNGESGLYMVGTNGNEVMGNRMENNGEHGILLGGSFKCRIERNMVVGNGAYGIRLKYQMAMDGGPYENTICNNIIRYHDWGIHLQKSNHNEIFENLVELSLHGIVVEDDSPDNKIFCNNLLRNHEHGFDACGNLWDGGITLGGNFWEGLKGEDLNGDRILDDPFRIPGKTACDRFPMLTPVPLFFE